MIADPDKNKPLNGYSFKDYIVLYCMKCKLWMKYVKDDNKIVWRHMESKHSSEINISLKRNLPLLGENASWGIY